MSLDNRQGIVEREAQAVEGTATSGFSWFVTSAAKADVAHRLRGSALAIGAFPVADAAAAVEDAGRAGARRGPEGPEQAVELSQAIADLSEAVAQAVAEIDRLPGLY